MAHPSTVQPLFRLLVATQLTVIKRFLKKLTGLKRARNVKGSVLENLFSFLKPGIGNESEIGTDSLGTPRDSELWDSSAWDKNPWDWQSRPMPMPIPI